MTNSLTGKYVFSASENQERLWFLQAYDKNASAAYNIAVAYDIVGDIDRVPLQKAYNFIIARHEALRTAIQRIDGKLCQIIEPQLKLPLNYDHMAYGDSSKEIEHILCAKITSCASASFDLSKAGLIRTTLYQISEDQFCLLLVVHHSVCDGTSIKILSDELLSVYNDYTNNSQPKLADVQFHIVDFSTWLMKWQQSKEYLDQVKYWDNLLGGHANTTSIRLSSDKNDNINYNGKIKQFSFNDDQVNKITTFANKYAVTPYSVLLSAYAYLISGYTKSNDFLIGIPVEHRLMPEFDNVVGFLANTLVVRIQIRAGMTVTDLVKSTHQQIAMNLSNQSISFSKIVEILQPDRSIQSGDIFRMFFAYQALPNSSSIQNHLKVRTRYIDTGLSKFDFSFFIFQTGSTLHGIAEYRSDFSDDYIDSFIENYLAISERFCEYPQLMLADCPFVTNVGASNACGPKAEIHEIFELISHNAIHKPDKIALRCGEDYLSYEQLDRVSTLMACSLINDYGLKIGDVVGISLPRSINLVLAILAVAKAGITYVPFTCEMPEQRKKHMVYDARLNYLISNHEGKDFPAALKLINVETLKCCEQLSTLKLPTNDAIAYINYTSGTTGLPKGVVVKWLGIKNLLSHFINEKIINDKDILLAVTAVSFDISVLELLLPLCVGAEICLATAIDIKDNVSITDLIQKRNITIMQATPSFWTMLFERNWAPPHSFKCLIGGEIFPEFIQRRFFINDNVSVYNLYGPTETTIWSTIKKITAGSTISIGAPIQNTDIYIVNDNMQIVPQCGLGEIVIAGAGVANGYKNNVSLTEKKFIKGIAFRTGDLGRLINGDIYFNGREDTQVKIRGHRIELSDIESVIARHINVSRVVAITINGNTNACSILAFVKLIKTDNQASLLNHLRDLCIEYLPEYERPSSIHILEEIPINTNGKVDSKRLIELYKSTISHDEIKIPLSSTEIKIEQIWRELLKIDSTICIEKNFFDLGGNSLLIARLVELINVEFNVSVGMKLAFTSPTIQLLAKNIDMLSNCNTSNGETVINYSIPIGEPYSDVA